MKMFWKITLFSFLVYLLSWIFVYLTGINTHALQSEDTIPAAFLPISIIKRGTVYLDEFYPMLINKYPHPDDRSYDKGLVPFYLRKVEDPGECISQVSAERVCTSEIHYVSAFPLITPILAIPIYLFPVLFKMSVTWELVYFLSHISAAWIMAFAGGLLYVLLVNEFSLGGKKSLLLTGVYLFATINYPMMSQSLWQHGTVQLFFILTLISLYRKNYFWASFSFCMAILARPTAIFISPIIGCMFLYQILSESKSARCRSIVSVFLGAVIPAVFFLFYNQLFYRGISNQGYYDHFMKSWLSKFPEGFIGTWISPSKGILVYSPVFIFSFVSMYFYFKNLEFRTDNRYGFYSAIVLLHTLVLSKWKHWYGGYSYGYRMSSDVLPFLVLLLVPYVRSEYFVKHKRVFMSLVILSVFIQLGGIVFFDSIWHSAYDKGFEDTSWLWSIKDSEFMFNIRRILVKIGIMHKACPKCLPS
ncbi:hypothetical protein JXA34_01050 [Patescibacteria group bacterium]|nr:hypothetical protein [Patescibacteria group bacterium]